LLDHTQWWALLRLQGSAMKIIYRGRLRNVELTFALGDLFDAKVDAIVNSEQTDFVLSGNPVSISGQIWHRYGDPVQKELDNSTQGQVLRPGTVLDTSGGKDFSRIFHAGFHEPDDWPDTSDGLQDADYFEAIGSCIRQVLESVRAQGLTSVAFPLLGCGLFGLDERMLILQFLDALEILDSQLMETEKLNVWLVIRDRVQFESAAGVFLELLLRARSERIVVRLEHSGVAILDRFAARLIQYSNEDWAKWQLCRYTEIALEIMCYALSRAISPPRTPEGMFKEGVSPTFGELRKSVHEFASASPLDEKVWGAKFFAGVLSDKSASSALETINTQRNNIAHGRKTLSLTRITGLVKQSLQLDDWEKISRADGELRLGDWTPWITVSPASGLSGLFERWQKNAFRYLVPETGEVFKIPRASL
jgi:O-acetyl-ADP-ribose deacetylase (regulator of RNase III)